MNNTLMRKATVLLGTVSMALTLGAGAAYADTNSPLSNCTSATAGCAATLPSGAPLSGDQASAAKSKGGGNKNSGGGAKNNPNKQWCEKLLEILNRQLQLLESAHVAGDKAAVKNARDLANETYNLGAASKCTFAS